MNFSWPEEYLKFKKEVIQFAQESLNDDLITRDREGIFSRENWKKCADFGILGLSVPSRLGGTDTEVNILKSMLAMEGFGYGCQDNGLSLGLNAQMWTVQLPILHFGNEAQHQKYLPDLVNGNKIACHALTEPNAGSDIYSMQMTAKKVEGGYVLNGEKCLITFAPIADLALVFANVYPEKGRWGVTAFLVENDTPGYTARPVNEKMGMRTVPIGELELKDCFVSEENRLGKEGTGFSIMNHSLEFDRCCILASQLGMMERQLEDAIAFARERKQFGQSIGKFQAVSHRIAEMKLRLETSRMLLYKVAWLKNEGKSAMLDAALLKLHLGESCVESSMDAVRIRGGSGYLTETGVERDMRDAIGGVLYAGTSDIQRNIIAGILGL